jgi:hypothetical protein
MDYREGEIKPVHLGTRKLPYLLFDGYLKTVPQGE